MTFLAPLATPGRAWPSADHARPDFRALRAAQSELAPWPYRDLDIAKLSATGWRPTPFHDLVLKVHQRCNLACSYCYVYTHADQSWRDRPAQMSEEIWRATAENLGRHVRAHDVGEVRVVLHGGEPLLFGADRLVEVAQYIRSCLPAGCASEIGLQTNGVLLTNSVLATLHRQDIKVGVSIDGPPAVHDRNRVRPNGSGSFTAVRAGLELLRSPEHRALYAGLLCTISLDVDPIECFDQLGEFEPPMIDFLLPHANWQQPPVRPEQTQAAYGTWLVAAFDRWYDGSHDIRVRLFEDIIRLLLGGWSRSEQVGLSPNAVLVVETDGSIEQVDALKSAYAGACGLGLNVRHDELDAALADPGIIARQIGREAMSDQCGACPVMRVCGGGHYAHRYGRQTGFLNRSVYCADMRHLIEHVNGRILVDVGRMTGMGAS